MRVIEILLGLFVLLIGARIFHFTYYRVKSTDRTLKLYIGVLCLIIIGLGLIIYGFDMS